MDPKPGSLERTYQMQVKRSNNQMEVLSGNRGSLEELEKRLLDHPCIHSSTQQIFSQVPVVHVALYWAMVKRQRPLNFCSSQPPSTSAY